MIAGCLAYQIVWVAFITFLAWFWLVRKYPPPSRLVSFNFLTPIFDVIAGGVLLNQPITDTLLLTLLLVGTGIYLVNRPAPDLEDDVYKLNFQPSSLGLPFLSFHHLSI
jgi:drug/metabolite transporter (DMT)-like permease